MLKILILILEIRVATILYNIGDATAPEAHIILAAQEDKLVAQVAQIPRFNKEQGEIAIDADP